MRYRWLAAAAAALLAARRRRVRWRRQTAAATAGATSPAAIAIDGSSTVFPFAQAAAEGFQGENPNVKITVGESGTGGGFEKFCAGETDISDASRPIDDEEEVPVCEKDGVTYSEVQVANDGIAVVTNTDLKIDCLTDGQAQGSCGSRTRRSPTTASSATSRTARRSRTPRSRSSGPGTDSGTFDFFTEEINGEKGDTRKDYQPSEDDNVLVQGVEGDKSGLGYFGFSYYEDNDDKLNLVAVDAGDGCVARARRRSRTTRTSRCRVRCSCTRARRPSRTSRR